jgi:hypothetical protein
MSWLKASLFEVAKMDAIIDRLTGKIIALCRTLGMIARLSASNVLSGKPLASPNSAATSK